MEIGKNQRRSIQFSKETVIVPADFYEHFKSHQMQMAVINSWIALYQFHNTVHIAEDPRFEFDAFNPLLLLQIENLDRITRYFYFKDLSLSKPLIK